MKSTVAKLLRVMCSMVVMLAVMAGITAVQSVAASSGIYTATAKSHYRHPTTGNIEDSGGEGSAVLGQSMTESALHNTALVEVDSNGITWVTLRMKLMDNIKSPKFQIDGKEISTSLMQEDYTNNTADFRFKINSENDIIRCNMYIIPMGRDVIFYITVGNLKAGSGDFITSITSKDPASAPDPKPNINPGPKPNSSTITKPSSSGGAEVASAVVSSQAIDNGANSSANSSLSSSNVSNTEGLVEFDSTGSNVSTTSSKTNNSSGNSVLWWIIAGIVIVAGVGGIGYFCFMKIRKNTSDE